MCRCRLEPRCKNAVRHRHKRASTGTRGRLKAQEGVYRYKRASTGTRGRLLAQEGVYRHKRASTGTR